MTHTIRAPIRAVSGLRSGRTLAAVGQFLLWTLLFGVAFTQWPLYSENQDTKFLQGLAAAGYGHLSGDWLANTIDPLPAFSALVHLTGRFLHPNFFYLYHALLLGTYLYSLVGIAGYLFAPLRTWQGRLLFSTVVIALHASLLPPFSLPTMGTSLGWLLQSGVANQYLLNPVLQPSTFGVLLILSIHLFLQERPYWAAASAALAAIFHSTYLPAAGVLTLAYCLLTLWQGSRSGGRWLPTLRRSTGIGLTALLLVLPVLLYNVILLGPTSPELWQLSQETIVRFRIPHHSLPRMWLDNTVYVKMGIVVLALIAVRRTRLFPVLFLAFLTAVGLTLLQMRIGNDTLAFIAPWRISVFLVPLSSALLIAVGVAQILRWLPERGRVLNGAIAVACALALALLVNRGAEAMRDSFATRANDSQVPLWHFARTHTAPGDVYLVPSFMASFRLATGAPVVITFKSHPYKDVEVLAWQERLAAVNDFYADPSCERVAQMRERYGVTHVVMEHSVLEQHPDFPDCPAPHPVHSDDRFIVYRVDS